MIAGSGLLRLAVATLLCVGSVATAQTGRASGDLQCLLEASLEVNLGSPVDGIIVEIKAERGDTVGKGQALVRLNYRVEAAAVEAAKGKAEYARRKAARNDELFQKQLISMQERDQLETESRLAELDLREKEELLRLRTIVSPIDGVVVDRFMAPGDQVSRAGSKILRLVRLDPLYVEVVAPASLFGRIRPGTSAEVAPEGPGQTAHRARVTVVDRVIDAASGTFRVRLELRNPGYKIPAGLRCRISGLGQ